MINKITMKNIASYKHGTVFDTDKKVNLIYGLNGTGKSTFSGYLYDLTNPQYSDCTVEGLTDADQVLVYNQQFIRDNFYETEDIHGIFTLSKENKVVKQLINKTKKHIIMLNDRKSKIDRDKVKIDLKYQQQVDDYQKEVWKIKTEYTGGDRVLEFCLTGLRGNKVTLFNHLLRMDLQSKCNSSYTTK